MYCLKCGRETSEDHVFCDECRKVMEKYPVRPGTAVMLPRHKDAANPKKSKRHPQPAPKEQIRRLKRQRAGLWALILCLSFLLIASGALIWHLSGAPGLRPGQNYAVVESTAAAK